MKGLTTNGKNLSQPSELQDRLELVAETSGVQNFILNSPRILIGSALNCDLRLQGEHISHIHAVLELKEERLFIYDMNSTHGCFVNEQKVTTAEILLNDKITFGDITFQFKKQTNKKIPDSKKVYPLSQENKEFSNYIFEDLDEIYPIFNYKLNEYAVEVLVMYHDQIFSAEYLPLKKGEYYLSPSHKNIHDIYVPSITKKTPFLKIENEHVFIENIEDYQLLLLKNQTSSVDTKSSFVLDDDQIVRFQKNHHQIFIRKVNAPPAVKSPPFMGRDKRLLKSLIPAVLFILVAFIVSELLVTFEEAPPKQVERIVTIYRPKADLVIKKEEKKIVEEKPLLLQERDQEPEKTLSPITETKPVVTKPLPAAPKVSPKPKPVTPPKLQIKTPIKYQPKMGGITTPNPVIPPSLKKAPAPFNPALKPTVKATPVEIKTYKPIVMPNNMGSILKKDSNVLEAKIESNKNISENFGIGTPHKVTGGNAQGKVDRAFVQGSATNLSGNVTGKIDSSVEASGLIQKDQIIVAEVPDDISIQGSIDPSAVQKKIREHIPQYQYCDQKTMNGSLSASGTKFPIRFSIGADGRATQISLEGNLNSAFKNCMITVFRNIQFPKPKGGGSVIVTQSLYFRQRN